VIDLIIAAAVVAFGLGAWAAGRHLPKVVAALFPVAVLVATFRDWLMAALALVICCVVVAAGRAQRRNGRGISDSH
jgi:hypothetical protein